jgi:hypothetical protein
MNFQQKGSEVHQHSDAIDILNYFLIVCLGL